jgi:hypothetical protein
MSALTRIRTRTFQHSERVCDLILPDSIVEIDSFAFSNCMNLVHVKFGANLNMVDSNAFAFSGVPRDGSIIEVVDNSIVTPSISRHVDYLWIYSTDATKTLLFNYNKLTLLGSLYPKDVVTIHPSVTEDQTQIFERTSSSVARDH